MKMHDGCRRRLAAVCGRYCGRCEAYLAGTCLGCGYCLGCGQRGDCPLFLCCVVKRGEAHCGVCKDFPCELYLSHAPPDVVAIHHRALLRRVEIGTDAWLDEQEGDR
ncbi:MAG: DUF3795 domain-containing protein [Anaerolineae bacterium]